MSQDHGVVIDKQSPSAPSVDYKLAEWVLDGACMELGLEGYDLDWNEEGAHRVRLWKKVEGQCVTTLSLLSWFEAAEKAARTAYHTWREEEGGDHVQGDHGEA